jgi:AP-2 complex subunit alpha
VDVILQLIDKAGDFVSDDIWFRVVQFVTNNEDLQVIKCLYICFVASCFFFLFDELPVSNKGFHIHIVQMRFYAFDQPYAAAKAREYLDKPAIHETMVKVCINGFMIIIFELEILFYFSALFYSLPLQAHRVANVLLMKNAL